jgi:single-stranded-DNA-specific exonuclease
MTEDEERGRALAQQLDELNRDRQQRTANAIALAQSMMGDAEPPPLIMIGHAEFSSGIVGLIASKLVTLYGRPAVVYEEGGETSRASCRSIEEFHITDALRAHAPLFVRFGGHRAAAGFTAENARLEEIRARLIDDAANALAGKELVPVLEIDANLPLRALRGDEIRWLARLGPFGIGNRVPTFLARDVLVGDVRWVGDGERHRRLMLRDGKLSWSAFAFDMGEIDVAQGDRIDVVYTIEAGRPDAPIELRVEDLRPAASAAAT